MDKLSVNARRAIKNYGQDKCENAHKLFSEGRTMRHVSGLIYLTTAQTNAAINAGRELKAIETSRGFAHNSLADIVSKFEDAPLYECEIPGTPGRVTRGGVTIATERAEKRIDLESVDIHKGREIQAQGIEYAFGKPGDNPRDLEFKPLGIGRLQIIEWDEAAPCGDDAVSHGMLTRLLPLHDPACPTKAFPHGFAPTILFPMRNGIRKIVVAKKGVDMGPWA